MVKGIGWRLRRWRHRADVRVPAERLSALGFDARPVPAQSLVIPAIGADYVEEGALAAQFAARFYPELLEIVVVSDQPASVFPAMPSRVRIATLDVEALVPAQHAYRAIYKSRLIKLLAPLQARHEHIVMTDSDLVILQPFRLPFAERCVMGSFRRGKMISKVRRSGAPEPVELSGTFRPYLWDHLNGAFLAATRATWARLSPAWLGAFLGIWSKLPDNQPPTDQLPLCCVLDHLGLVTVDLGTWVNWPVSKEIGGRSARVPAQVIGAHGGFPLDQWRRYLDNPEQPLTFVGQDESRKVRYQQDAKRS